MTNEQWNTTLYKQMFTEQEQFRDWLLAQPPEEILNHAYEYVMREDILLSLEYNDLTDAQAAGLLTSPSPLADVYAEFDKLESSHMEEIWSCIESRADALQAGLLDRAKTLIDEFCAYEYASQADFSDLSRVNIRCPPIPTRRTALPGWRCGVIPSPTRRTPGPPCWMPVRK